MIIDLKKYNEKHALRCILEACIKEDISKFGEHGKISPKVSVKIEINGVSVDIEKAANEYYNSMSRDNSLRIADGYDSGFEDGLHSARSCILDIME
jgi:hypothetical protein